MEVFPTLRAQSPAHSRAPRAVGELRLHAILRALLSLLTALLGRRHAARTLALPAHDTTMDWWITLPDSDSGQDLEALLPSELPLQLRRLLYLFGTRRNRGMRTLPRALPTPRARIARGPPHARIFPPHTQISAKSPQPGDDDARPSSGRAYPRTSPTTRARTRRELPGR